MLLAKIKDNKIIEIVDTDKPDNFKDYTKIPETLPADTDLRLYKEDFTKKSLEELEIEGLYRIVWDRVKNEFKELSLDVEDENKDYITIPLKEYDKCKKWVDDGKLIQPFKNTYKLVELPSLNERWCEKDGEYKVCPILTKEHNKFKIEEINYQLEALYSKYITSKDLFPEETDSIAKEIKQLREELNNM